MCKNCIYFESCNFGVAKCCDYISTEDYINDKKNLYREEFLKMMNEWEGGNDYCESEIR